MNNSRNSIRHIVGSSIAKNDTTNHYNTVVCFIGKDGFSINSHKCTDIDSCIGVIDSYEKSVSNSKRVVLSKSDRLRLFDRFGARKNKEYLMLLKEVCFVNSNNAVIIEDHDLSSLMDGKEFYLEALFN